MPDRCKNGEISRDGKKVKPACTNTKARVFTTPIINTMLRKELMAENKCSTDGKRNKTVVPASCFTEQGKKDGRVGLYKGVLVQSGYHMNMNVLERRRALDRTWLVLNKNWLSLFRMLNYLAVFNKNNKPLHMLLISDRDYVKMKYSGQFGGMQM